jgi:hypothetical protein
MPSQRNTKTKQFLRNGIVINGHAALSWDEPEIVRSQFEARYTVVQREYQTPCFEWNGPFWKVSGYGCWKIDGKNTAAHRTAWRIYNGSIPAGALVCHKCDNRKCARIDHLFVGSYQDNSDDAKSKNRIAIQRGSVNGNSKLNDQQVLAIRQRLGFESGRKIARAYGVTPALISKIKLRKMWFHI